MSKPMHLCNHPGCSKLIPYDQRYCSKHEYHKPIDQADSQERHKINQTIYHKRTTSQHEGKYQLFILSVNGMSIRIVCSKQEVGKWLLIHVWLPTE